MGGVKNGKPHPFRVSSVLSLTNSRISLLCCGKGGTMSVFQKGTGKEFLSPIVKSILIFLVIV